MNAETLKTIADKLIAHCRAGTTKEGLDELYDPAAVSVEAIAMPGSGGRETAGVEGIKGKHDWWDNTMEVHSSSVEGPFLHGDDRFAVIFAFDATDRTNDRKVSMREVAVYTVSPAGKIIREEFYYT